MLEEARDGGEQVAGVREAALLGLRRHVATVGFLRIAEAINTRCFGSLDPWELPRQARCAGVDIGR